ncbi:MAG TPA: hypothetical protein PKK15_14760 [Kouleothrix sp.]|uniref:hypothetical protein n=1 Tax=Kouleothrix sp. TaxID=2779161 RepID=UPI002CFAE784|nr:hypothetical protein [Kouleothrix sp.]
MVATPGPLAQSKIALSAVWKHTWPVLRPALGWTCIALGLLGVVLPVIPGLPLLFPGIALVGRRTWLIRWASVQIKRALRRWAPLRLPLIGPVGLWALRAQQQISRQRRRLAWRYMQHRSSKGQNGAS